MSSYEKILIVGNIGVLEPQTSKAGNSFLRMSVAVNRIVGNQKVPVWYSVFLFGKMAENVEALKRVLTKGRLVLVEGRPQTDTWLKKDGSIGVDHVIIADKLPFLMDAPPAQQSQAAATQQRAAPANQKAAA
jgi:single stranded DNA-binding protein